VLRVTFARFCKLHNVGGCVKFGDDSAPQFGGDEVLAFFLPCPEVYELFNALLFEVVIVRHV